ncbi:MAG: hypothetical protein WCJ56_13940 [bacterium]
MSKYKIGEFIDLIWECGVEEYHIKGHIDPQAALEILQREFPGMKFTMPVALPAGYEAVEGVQDV